MNKGTIGAIALASLTLLIIMVSLLLFSVPMVLANSTDNLTTSISVGSVAPNVSAITCVPAVLTPTPGNNTVVRCYTTIGDQNGWGNIDKSSLNVSLWIGVSRDSPDDLNNHYSNGTSSHQQSDCCWGDACGGTSSGETIDVSCNFTIRYFADPSASWNVNFTVEDAENNEGTNITTWGVNGILGLDVANGTISFGAVALGGEGNSSVLVYNIGNQDIDLRMAETNGTGGELVCDGASSDNITTSSAASGVRYNKTTVAWASMEKLTGTNYDFVHWDQAYYNASGTTDGIANATLYWTARLPGTGVAGTCSGITRFTVIDDA